MTTSADTLFTSGQGDGSGWHDRATVPAGHLWVIKSASFYRFGGGLAILAFAINQGGTRLTLAQRDGAPSDSVLQYEGRAVVPAGSKLSTYCDGTSIFQWYISGFDVTL